MSLRRSLVGLIFCTCYLASYLVNKVSGGGLLLAWNWPGRLVWLALKLSSDVSTWLPASVLFVGVIYAGSRALSRLAIPVFFILHNVAEAFVCVYRKCFWKEKTSLAKICSTLFLLAAAGCLPFNDSQYDPDGYFWAAVHVFCIGAYKVLRKSQKHNALSDIDQQYLNYIFRLFTHFSGFLGFFLMLSTVKLKSLLAPGQCAAWIFLAKVTTAGLSLLLFDVILTLLRREGNANMQE
uniref:Transmembrane protein 241 n=1 Tax=Jaculus jaculus TaxID=51337 RepID=A0A8C5P125_JACJA